LIPDISGYTEFMTTFELEHSSHAINMLMDAMVNAVGQEYEVAEIEGDAVLLIRKGPAPSKSDIEKTCLGIFNAFHYQRKWMQQHTVCPCGACQGLINLTLKFIAHHGPVAEIRVGKFVKQSGAEMIVAHRLLKNAIDAKEYLLVTEKLLEQDQQSEGPDGVSWLSSFEEYPAIGKINYRYMHLTDARKQVPDPPDTGDYEKSDNTSYLELEIDAGYRDVYMVVMNIPARINWWPGLLRVEQDIPQVFIGSVHHCFFENYQGTITPVKMILSDDGFSFVERFHIPQINGSVIYEYVFNEISESKSRFCCRIQNEGNDWSDTALGYMLFKNLQQMSLSLKDHCSKLTTSLFEPTMRNRMA